MSYVLREYRSFVSLYISDLFFDLLCCVVLYINLRRCFMFISLKNDFYQRGFASKNNIVVNACSFCDKLKTGRNFYVINTTFNPDSVFLCGEMLFIQSSDTFIICLFRFKITNDNGVHLLGLIMYRVSQFYGVEMTPTLLVLEIKVEIKSLEVPPQCWKSKKLMLIEFLHFIFPRIHLFLKHPVYYFLYLFTIDILYKNI